MRVVPFTLGFIGLFAAGCATIPPKSGTTERAVVVVRECLPGGDKLDEDSLATIYATTKAVRVDVNCGRRPYRIVFRAHEDRYVHYEVNDRETRFFTTEQVKELADLRNAVAVAATMRAESESKPEENRLVAALLANADEAMAPLRRAKFKPASIGETIAGVHCRRYDLSYADAFTGEACLTRADQYGVDAGSFEAFRVARDKFRGLLGAAFETFDPLRTVDGVDFLIVRMSFGNGSRGIAVPRLRSVAVEDVPVEVWDPARIQWSANE